MMFYNPYYASLLMLTIFYFYQCVNRAKFIQASPLKSFDTFKFLNQFYLWPSTHHTDNQMQHIYLYIFLWNFSLLNMLFSDDNSFFILKTKAS